MQQKTMKHKMLPVLFSLMGFALTGCEKLNEPNEQAGIEAIPATFGSLVGVTADSGRPYRSLLWFEQPDKTIVAVSVNTARGTIYKRTVIYPRK